MTPETRELDGEVLCPRCDYDLRGQSEAKCPECGATFGSIEAMVRASMNVNRLLRRVMFWRQRLAYFMFPSLVMFTIGIWLERAGCNMSRGLGLLLYTPLPIAGGCTLALLIQVIRWHENALTPRRQREALGASVAWLIFCSSPVVFLLYGIVAKFF
ncbi:MAG TPA: hypothetical protein P5081_04745 [Phycisphaerae bacterium]|nr:hypothetical protein [Phycisphaerae bacterium]HRW52171.1 hypothetical protein [Phycisphaerae bacterium]